MFYPVFIELSGKDVLVVGGGPVAERKVDSLLEAGARVTLVSPDATDRLASSNVTWKRRMFQESDLNGMTIVVSATDNPEVQKEVAAKGLHGFFEGNRRPVHLNHVAHP